MAIGMNECDFILRVSVEKIIIKKLKKYKKYKQEKKRVTELYLNIPYLTLSLCYKLRKSYRDPKGCRANLRQ